jgi:pilus assembly protein CpaB
MIKRQKLIGIVVSVLLAGIGTALLVAYVRSAEDRALAGEKTVGVLVVSDTIVKGTKAEDIAGKVRLEQVPTKVLAKDAVANISSLSGKVAVVDLLPGEQVVPARFGSAEQAAGIPAGMLQVTVSLDPVRALGGQVREGDLVGVTASFDDPESTHMILHKVRITDVRTSTDGAVVATKASATAPVSPVLVTMALDAPSVEKVVFAAEHGTLWLSWEPKEANEGGTKVLNRQSVNL